MRHRGPKANGGTSTGDRRNLQLAFTAGSAEPLLGGRLRLLEGFIGRTDAADCAQYALQWLGEHLGVSQSVCLVKRPGEQSLIAIASHGFVRSEVGGFTLSLEDWANPLVAAFNDSRLALFPTAHSAAERRRRPHTPFEDLPFQAVPLGVTGASDEAFAQLLIAWQPAAPRPELQWFFQHFGQKLDQSLREQSLSDGGRKHGRERSLLYSIINAVTDPILLTDTEGRLMIANARALTLFTASEEESEGRRGAVRMNNMLFSSALSSKAIEETGAAGANCCS